MSKGRPMLTINDIGIDPASCDQRADVLSARVIW